MKSILIVDGCGEVRHSVTMLLRQAYPQMRVIAVRNGQEAVMMALYEDPALILLGADMPIMNGYETAHRLRQMPRTRQIPLVALTREQDPRSIAAGLQRLCDAFLSHRASDSQIMQAVGTLAV